MVKWVLVKVLGKGSYAVVLLARQMIGPLAYYFAIKVTTLQQHSLLAWEEQVLKCFIGCPEIVQCLGSEITTTGNSSVTTLFNLKLEYASKGTLDDLIKQRKNLPENEVKEYLKMILRGLSCIHHEGFVHVDLKPTNILVFPKSDGKIQLKIADFGLSKRCGQMDDEEEDDCGVAAFRGTPTYMSPESIIFSEVNSALDIWSLGCILVEMVSGKPVWDDCKSRDQLMTRLLDDMDIPTIPDELFEQGKDFISKCFVRDYKQRWTADMLLQHPYLSEENEVMKKCDGISKLAETIFLPHQLCKHTTLSSNNWISKL
ncbi:unnamed protein product [Citrullus colocynthis]|uniref:Protein kinase domain-containing protein n=1 Tax=Citrullus colocynthis TaxID=252529 RepID=A0ABP0YK33_9ROSI